jgi:hypothetical protein
MVEADVLCLRSERSAVRLGEIAVRLGDLRTLGYPMRKGNDLILKGKQSGEFEARDIPMVQCRDQRPRHRA